MKSVNDLPNVRDFQPKLQFPQDTPVLEFTPRFPTGILFWFLEATVVQLPPVNSVLFSHKMHKDI
jgi:hypothetical protein